MSSRKLLIDLGTAAIAFALTLVVLAAGAAGDRGSDDRELDVLGVALASLASLPLVVRRRAPLAVFALTAAASVALNAFGYPQGPPFGPTIALFFLAAEPSVTRTGQRVTAATVVGFFVAHLGAAGIGRDALPVVPLLFGVVVWVGAWVIGDRVRQRRERIAGFEERALRAEREAEGERRLAAAEERTRIARELHDSAGHAINVILVQAGAARLHQERDPAKTQSRSRRSRRSRARQ